jgi:hypothetical protein
MELQDNKVIAEFMGYKHIPDSIDNFEHYIKEGTIVFPYKIKYYSDWNELMAVVKKASSIWGLWDFEDDRRLKAEAIFYMDNMYSEFINNDIDSVYSRVVEFIKWYNLELK